MVKYGFNIYRSLKEKEYYYRNCNKIHHWEIINRNGNYLQLQCRDCGILGHSEVRKMR